ncbi:hypothetical protein E4633_06355 [Geomonas terrae]|uniref:Uncharacterized protein n=1 Tax=Geomonas terrae TaxID=2562681 RepID=A0A4S1CN46_9BACT|nr:MULTISPECIES: hypothetical protein [Geomonas]TGU75073.1 hypothetical protein E4633_06355 [Geomonas terrae]
MKLTDVLILGPEELRIVREEYPDCKVDRLSNSDTLIQQYRITLELEEENTYYNFLLENCMAMSSHNFYYRVKVDKIFSERIRKRKLV